MDRFIARSINRAITSEKNLKSNMDRFIELNSKRS